MAEDIFSRPSKIAGGNADESLHAARVARSEQLLKTARENAATEYGYDSQNTRLQLSHAFREACRGQHPYSWQLDVSEALLLGIDTVLTAGTGAGKTMPFVMPLLLQKSSKKMVIIISPLNELERDQARRFEDMGLSAAAVNGEDYTSHLHQKISAKSVQVLVTSPEMCLEHPLFSALVHSPDFMRDVLYVIVDEAHCISQWGDKFRKKYAELSKLRSFLGVRKAFGLATATFPAFMAADVFLRLEFREPNTYFCNLGNNRANITPIVHRLKAAQSSLPIIDFVVHDARPGMKLPRALLFFNSRDLTFKAYRHLQDCVCSELWPQINFLHAGRGRRARRRAVKQFRSGDVNILCATEAAGMGMDISDVDIVVQFLIPSSLSVWTQRAGRAGRSGDHCMAILLVEPTVFEARPIPRPQAAISDPKVNAKGTMVSDGPGGAIEYKKHAEDGMRLWAGATSCRRAIADEYFSNPPRDLSDSGLVQFPCCDNCVRAKQRSESALSSVEVIVLDVIERLAKASDVGWAGMDGDDEEGDIPIKIEIDELALRNDPEDMRAAVPTGGSATRRGDHLAACRARLYRWRMETWHALYAHCIFPHHVLLPDTILTRLASQRRFRTTMDLKQHISQWAFVDLHGAEVLHVLSVIDTRHQIELDVRKQLKMEAREQRILAKGKRSKDLSDAENTPQPGGQIKEQRSRSKAAKTASMSGPGQSGTTDTQEPRHYVFKAHVFPHTAKDPGGNVNAPSQAQSSAAIEALPSYPGPVRFAL